MKKSIITAFGIIALSFNTNAQSNINHSKAWKPWKPAQRSAGIYFKPRMATPVYGLKSVADGQHFAEVDELSNMGQQLTTIPGKVYQVKYALAHRQSAGDKTFRIVLNGQVVQDLLIDNNDAPASFEYQSFEFKATEKKTFLGFYVVSLSGDPNRGVLVDDVTVQARNENHNLVADGSFELGARAIQRTARSSSSAYRVNGKVVHMDELAMLEDEAESFDASTNFRIGMYYMLESKVPGRALNHFELAKKGSYEHPELEYYLARAYHLNHKFGKAVAAYHKYNRQLRKSSDPKASEKSAQVKTYMEDCLAGTALVPDSLALAIKSLGKHINSNYPDYVPLVSADETTLIFTSRRRNSTGGKVASDGNFYEDIYMSTKNDKGQWSKPAPIEGLNSDLHDASIGLSYDGKQLFIYKDSNGGDIYVSNRKGKHWTKPQALQGDVNSRFWEGSASISKDGKYLYFASNRPGGFGGADIYRSQRQANGTWGKAQNLGPAVNTSRNEDAPQIHTDNETLFFSSMGHKGMGGYDIFSTVFDRGTATWSAPKNVGYPINTAQDDIHFSLNAAGNKAYFNSAYFTADGQNDIYVMERPQLSASLFLLKGKVAKKNDQQSFEAKVILTNKKTKQVQTTTTSDLENGTYAFNMAFDTEYTLAIESDTYKFNTRDIKVGRKSDLFQYTMNFVVDNDKMYVIEQQDISQISMNEKQSYAVLAVSR
jgi:hypothetical protein